MRMPLWVKRYMLRTKHMKAVIEIGYRSYVMEADKALTLLGLLENAERYEEKYRGSGQQTTYHVYEEETIDRYKTLKLIDDKAYNLAKLAGKPEEK